MPTAIDYLISAQHNSGGWGYSSTQKPVVEPTSAVLLAIRDEPQAYEAYQKGIAWLVNSQHQDGGWGICEDDPESGWQTAWALLVLKQSIPKTEVITKAVEWLVTVGTYDISGEEFMKPDFPQSASYNALIWPWLPKQVGFVEPTAMALLALEGLTDLQVAEDRISVALRYFQENRTPDGGWSTGNAGPLDTIVLPRTYPTTLVLLALAYYAKQDILPKDISALEQDMQRDPGILAQSCGALALQTLGKSDEMLKMKITGQQQADGSWNVNPFHTAWAIMALRSYFA
ncbi:MAG: prenyltransferase/squalene oxidase repeat-containing protein [Anaerolineales bacterium]